VLWHCGRDSTWVKRAIVRFRVTTIRRNTMADKNVWFVTGAGRGMGVDIARAALKVA
jgi:hypothetical protein